MGVVVGGVAYSEFGDMEVAVRQIGDPWSLLIVWSALQGVTRFDDFKNRLGVATNILTNRLSTLVDAGILVKHPVHIGALRREYQLTGKGEALRPALNLMELWGMRASIDQF